ncbi:DEDD exonuclease domain-containing protein [Brooklawnia sp.]|uniref:DEDD exonuclease domain-containing protein n=1 Tax=Brooklawnia sp. TaxID=2699740 RepID=UPI00311DFAA4
MTYASQMAALQPSLDDLGTPLDEAVFCVVDLETTGSGPEASITEFGAVKVRGGEVLGEFGTLVNPGTHIPGFIAVLTGITNQMVDVAPRLAEVLPSWLEFSRGAVLVAHNARFDIGFLKRACEQLGYPWPGHTIVDTVGLARQALLPGEVPNVKLHTLADHFHAATQPNHRALSDARATVDVLHGLLERVGNLGVLTIEDLKEFEHRVSPQRRAKRTWAAELPEAPGVYTFYSQRPGQARQVLYVGKASNIRRRVRTYFTSSETRPRMDEMVRVATGVDAVVCATELEAEVRELRTIAAHGPRYNRRSRRQDKVAWIKLTCERFPRLSVVSSPADDQADYWGPFSSRSAAQDACQVIYDAYPLRQCTMRIGAKTAGAGCVLGELGKCLAPCRGNDPEGYAAVAGRVRQAFSSDLRPTVTLIGQRIAELSAQQRYEQAEILTSRLRGYIATTQRFHRLIGLSRCRQIVAAQWVGAPAPNSGWQIHVVRFGRLAAAATAPAGVNPLTTADEALRMAETVLPSPHGMPSASVEEAERIAAWLERPGVRLIDIDGDWSMPLHCGIDGADLPRLALGSYDSAAEFA